NPPKGCSPVTMAVVTPIFQPVLDFTCANATLLRIRRHLGDHLWRFPSIPGARAYERSVIRRALTHLAGRGRRFSRPDDDADGQVVLPGKFEVALIVRRHRH